MVPSGLLRKKTKKTSMSVRMCDRSENSIPGFYRISTSPTQNKTLKRSVLILRKTFHIQYLAATVKQTSHWSLTNCQLHIQHRQWGPHGGFWSKTKVLRGQLPSLRSESSDRLSHFLHLPHEFPSTISSLALSVKINGVNLSLLANWL